MNPGFSSCDSVWSPIIMAMTMVGSCGPRWIRSPTAKVHSRYAPVSLSRCSAGPFSPPAVWELFRDCAVEPPVLAALVELMLRDVAWCCWVAVGHAMPFISVHVAAVYRLVEGKSVLCNHRYRQRRSRSFRAQYSIQQEEWC